MNKELFYVETINCDNVILPGYYSGKKNNKCILYIPGLGASYESSLIPKEIFKYCGDFDFLCGLNQGNGIITELLINDDINSIKNSGASYEDYSNWYSDIDAWISYLNNYENIIVIAHSLGCNKIIDYLNRRVNNKISKLILLSPQDTNYLINLNKHCGMLEEALENKENKNNNLLSNLFLGFCYLSTNTFLDFYYNKDINNIPYLSTKDYTKIKNIKCSIDIIIGSKDKIDIDFKLIFTELCNECSNVSYNIIEGANHNYNGKENDLAKLIFNIINNDV